MDSWTYTGSINNNYIFRKYNSELSTTQYMQLRFQSSISFPVETYAYSNVDAFGALALCWHNAITFSPDLTTQVKTSADMLLSVDEKFGSAWNQISAKVIEDSDKVKAKGWMSVNTRNLSK